MGKEKIGWKNNYGETNIHPTAKVSKLSHIGEGVTIGENSCIDHFCVISDGVVIGRNCKIQSGTVIGEDGFGYERDESGIPIKITHLGTVIIEDNVEIGNCTVIDRGTLGNTIIKKNVKIDNLVHIAHNVVIEDNSLIIACSEISGGVIIGKGSWVGPNSSIIQKVKLGSDSFVGIGSNVIKDVENFAVVAGNPAKIIRMSKWITIYHI